MTKLEARAQQSALVLAGHKLAIDGVWGPRSAAALLAETRRRGLDLATTTTALLSESGLVGLRAVVGGDLRDPPGGVDWHNWHSPGVRMLTRGWWRGGGPLPYMDREPTQIVIHESACRDAIAVLLRRQLSVEVVVHRDGSVTQHADLMARTVHAGVANGRSVAIEVENRYYGSGARPGETVIGARWAHRGRYILPTPAQIEAAWQVIRWLPDVLPSLTIAFPCAPGPGGFEWGRKPSHWDEPGLLAHHRQGAHADGLVPEHYCACRARGLDAATAYAVTVEAAASRLTVTTIPRPEVGHVPLAV